MDKRTLYNMWYHDGVYITKELQNSRFLPLEYIFVSDDDKNHDIETVDGNFMK